MFKALLTVVSFVVLSTTAVSTFADETHGEKNAK